MLAVAHLAEPGEVVLRRAAAEAAVGAGRAEVAAGGAHLLGRLLVDVGVAAFDQVLGRAVHEVEVVAGVVEVAGAVGIPVVAQPLHRVDDAVDVFLFFFLRVGVVEAQMANAAVFLGEAKVQPDALGVADVQVTVGLRRKTRADLGGVCLAFFMLRCITRLAAPLAACVGALRQVALDHLAQEVADLVIGFGGTGVAGGRRVILG